MKQAPYAELPREEFESRLKKAQELMENRGLNAILLFGNKDVYYYSGYRRTVATVKVEGILIPATRPPVMFVPQLTSRYCEKAVWVEDVRFYGGASHLNYTRTVVDLVVQTLKELALDSGIIGLELGGDLFPDISFSDLQAIINQFPSVTFVDASPLIWEQRKNKSPFEQDILRTAAKIALEGFQEGLKSLREGMTEADLAQTIWKSWFSRGIADTPMEGQLLIRSGCGREGPEGRYRCTHARPTDYPIRKGETVLLDAGPCYRGYFADLMRQGCVGRPSDLLSKLFDTATVGYRKGIELLKPGVKISDLAQQAIKAMVRFNPKVQYPLSFVGHSIGLAIHEPPWFCPTDESFLEPGMVINFEIGAYDSPLWRTLGAFLEDMFLITEEGCENLTEEGTITLWVTD